MMCLLLCFCLFMLRVHFGYSCSPCTCSRATEGAWTDLKEASCEDLLHLTSIPDTLDKDIQILLLNVQNLESLDENSFIQFDNLKVIHIKNNLIQEIDEFAFRNMKYLTEINLEQNEINMLPINIFSETVNIENISLNNNEVTILENNLFSNLNYLREIYLNDNNINIIEINCFQNLPALQIINLDNNQLIVLRKNTFNNLTSLKQINLSNNKISSIHVDCFTNVPLLYKINLSYNNLTKLRSNIIDNTNSLTRMFLNGNPWDCTENLCEFMDTAMAYNWLDSRYIPECNTPKKLRRKKWTSLTEDFLIEEVRGSHREMKVEEGSQVTFQCKYCFVSKLIWIYPYDDNQIFNNDKQEIRRVGKSLVSSLTVKYFEKSEEFYQCMIRGCGGGECYRNKLGFKAVLIGKNYRLVRHVIILSIILLPILIYYAYPILKRRYSKKNVDINGETLSVAENNKALEIIETQSISAENKKMEENKTTSAIEDAIQQEELEAQTENCNGKDLSVVEDNTDLEIIETQSIAAENNKMEENEATSAIEDAIQQEELEAQIENVENKENENITNSAAGEIIEQVLTPTTNTDNKDSLIHEEDINITNANEEEVKKETVFAVGYGLIATAMFCILHLIDICSSLSLVISFYIHGSKISAYIIISAMYVSSLNTTIFERQTHKKKNVKYYFVALGLFVLNASTILLFIDTLKIQGKKLQLTIKELPDGQLNNKLLVMEKNLIFIRAIEGFMKNLIIMITIIYFETFTTTALEIGEIQMISFITSYIILVSSVVEFTNSVSPRNKKIFQWVDMPKYLWRFCIIVAKLNTILIATTSVAREYVVMVTLHSFLFGRYSFQNLNNSNEIRKNFLTSNLFGLIYMISPHLHIDDKGSNVTEAINMAHIQHFADIFVLSVYFTRYYILYYLLTIGLYLLGILFYILFNKMTKK